MCRIRPSDICHYLVFLTSPNTNIIYKIPCVSVSQWVLVSLIIMTSLDVWDRRISLSGMTTDTCEISKGRLLLKAGCAPCLAGCKWYGICTKWVENLLFEVILVAFSSVSRPETWRTLFFDQKKLSGDQKRRFLRKMSYLKNRWSKTVF